MKLKCSWACALAALVVCIGCLTQAENIQQLRPAFNPRLAESPYTWTCRKGKCEKVESSKLGSEEKGSSLEVCQLNCDTFGTLWPRPTGKVELGKNNVNFYPQNVIVRSVSASSPESKETIEKQIAIFREYLLQSHPDYENVGVSPFPPNATDDASKNYFHIDIGAVWVDKKVKIGNDESYVLSSQVDETNRNVSVTIMANSVFGCRHALETLSQLIAYNENTNTLTTLDRATVSDSPVFPYRGLLIDTSRNFLSLKKLKRVVDGMSYNKLNVLHWHITDTHSFPFYSTSVPEMTKYGAYSPRKIYTVEDMNDLVEYGRVRGVKILPEFDAPAHVGNGWQWTVDAGKGETALCINKEPWTSYCVEPPCGQLNPVNEQMYEILGKIYGDMMKIFDNELFHMGGDEVKLTCWEETQEITDYFVNQGKNNTAENLIGLWGDFQNRAYDLVAKAQANQGDNFTAILWTSELASIEHVQQYLDKAKYIIQIWSTGKDPIVSFLIKNGYRTIFSNYDAWYLDCGYGAWIGAGNNWCSPYKGWQLVYDNSPLKLLNGSLTQEEIDTAFRNGQILGGEAALWAEQVDGQALESKLWPRGQALGERLWSNPNSSWTEAEVRMNYQRERLVQRGLQPDALQPEWCIQNPGLCYG